MKEDLLFMQTCADEYRAMLKLYMSAESRAIIMRLLAEAEYKIVAAPAGENISWIVHPQSDGVAWHGATPSASMPARSRSRTSGLPRTDGRRRRGRSLF